MTTPPQSFEDACQKDCDAYRAKNLDCLGYDYGNAWQAGRDWTLRNDPTVLALVAALEELEAGYGGMFGHESTSPQDDAWEMAPKIVIAALTAYREATKGEYK